VHLQTADDVERGRAVAAARADLQRAEVFQQGGIAAAVDDACALPPLPMTILYGTLDAVMVPKHFKTIQRQRRNVVIETAITGHEIRKRYAKLIAKHLEQ